MPRTSIRPLYLLGLFSVDEAFPQPCDSLRFAKVPMICTTDEIDKPFLLRDLLFWRGRVTAWQARGCQPGRAAVTVAPHWRHPCAGYQDHAAAIG